MKNIYYFLLIMFLAAGFSACSDDVDLNMAPPQSYPQEESQVIDGFTIAIGDAFSSAIVITDEEKELQVVKATAMPKLVEGATVVFRTEISDNQDFTNVVELPTKSADNAATTTSSELNELIKTLFGRAPKARTIYLRTYFYILDGTSASMMPTPYIYGPVTVTPHSIVTIEPAYYLIGDVNGWIFDNLDAYKFSHSDADVYDDPIFTITVQMAGYFKIVPQSSKDADSWDGVIGNPVDGNTELEGTLIVNDAQAMRILEDQWVKITLDMMESTYKVELLGNAKRELYVPGGHQGWNPATAPIVYSPNLDWKFDGYVYMEGGNEFKFTSTPDPNWSGTNYGDGGDGTLSTDGGAGNLSVSENGFYRLTVDLSKDPYTYTVTATTWGLIGDATPGGWDASTPMTLNSATGEWSVTTTLSGGKDFKFRANDGWDINLGGEATNLTYGGGNIPVAEDGTYGITLKLGDASAYTYTIVKQ